MTNWQFWSLNAGAFVALVLAAVNITLFLGNRDVQAEVLNRQHFVNQSIRLSRLNTQLIRALAALSEQHDDAQIRELLAAHGISVNARAQDR